MYPIDTRLALQWIIKDESNPVLIASRLDTDYDLSCDVSHGEDVRIWEDKAENTTVRFTYDCIRRWITKRQEMNCSFCYGNEIILSDMG